MRNQNAETSSPPPEQNDGSLLEALQRAQAYVQEQAEKQETRRAVLVRSAERTERRCEICDGRENPYKGGSRLVTFYLDSDRTNKHPSNLVSVCLKCARRKSNREQLMIAMKAIMARRTARETDVFRESDGTPFDLIGIGLPRQEKMALVILK